MFIGDLSLADLLLALVWVALSLLVPPPIPAAAHVFATARLGQDEWPETRPVRPSLGLRLLGSSSGKEKRMTSKRVTSGQSVILIEFD